MKDSNPNSFIRFTGLAFEMLAFILIGVWGGVKLDEYMKTDNSICTITFSLLSIVGSIIYVIRKLPKE